jgi:guanylate kinase
MREGETNGVDYEFLTNEEYAAAAAREEFFMDNEIMGYRYATRRSALEEVWAQGKICILQIYYTVLHQFIAAYPHAYAIYLRPANQKILEDRLRQRCPRQEDFERELGEANAELGSIGPYLHFYRAVIPVSNDDVQPIVDLIDDAVASKKLEAQPA